MAELLQRRPDAAAPLTLPQPLSPRRFHFHPAGEFQRAARNLAVRARKGLRLLCENFRARW
jgi:hypothetical protein